MMRTVKKVAKSYNCESLEIANPSFLRLKNRGLANPSKVANREHCESLRAQLYLLCDNYHNMFNNSIKSFKTHIFSQNIMPFISIQNIEIIQVTQYCFSSL